MGPGQVEQLRLPLPAGAADLAEAGAEHDQRPRACRGGAGDDVEHLVGRYGDDDEVHAVADRRQAGTRRHAADQRGNGVHDVDGPGEAAFADGREHRRADAGAVAADPDDRDGARPKERPQRPALGLVLATVRRRLSRG